MAILSRQYLSSYTILLHRKGELSSMARKNTNNKESYPLDRIRDEDLSEFHRWTVDLKEVRKMFPGYDIFTQLEAHIFLGERPDKYYKDGDSKQYWNDRVKEMRREVSN